MRKLGAILWLVMLAAPAFAQQTKDITLAWDPNAAGDQVVRYKLYERVGTEYQFRLEVPASACSATECRGTIQAVPAGVHTYVATAENFWESGYSNEASTPAQPPGPSRFRIIVTVEVITP